MVILIIILLPCLKPVVNRNRSMSLFFSKAVAITIRGIEEVSTEHLITFLKNKRLSIGMVLTPKFTFVQEELIVRINHVFLTVCNGFLASAVPEKFTGIYTGRQAIVVATLKIVLGIAKNRNVYVFHFVWYLMITYII